jgi:hypothetical protein
MAQTRITSQDIKDGTIVNADISGSAAIDATKIHDGTVSNTEFGYLNNVGSQVVGISDTNTLSNKTLTGTTNSVTATYLRNNDGTQVLVSGAPPTNGQVLQASSSTQAAWTTPAGGLSTSNFVFNEIPSGTIDGSNAAFTLANASNPTGSIRVFKNGIRQTPNVGNDFVMTNSTTITFEALNLPQVGDNLLVDYMK